MCMYVNNILYEYVCDKCDDRCRCSGPSSYMIMYIKLYLMNDYFVEEHLLFHKILSLVRIIFVYNIIYT